MICFNERQLLASQLIWLTAPHEFVYNPHALNWGFTPTPPHLKMVKWVDYKRVSL